MATVSGLKIDRNIVSFEFRPSIGIVAKRIDRLGLDIRSFRVPLTRAVKQVMIPSIQENFSSGGRPPWPALAEETVARKKSDQILIATGALRRVMGQINIWSIGPTTATIRDLPPTVKYGLVHQAGAVGGSSSFGAFARRVLDMSPKAGLSKGDVFDAMNIQASQERQGQVARGGTAEIPQRQFVMIQPEDEEKIVEIFSQWLNERIAGIVLRR
jgi:phage gpG-like protein